MSASSDSKSKGQGSEKGTGHTRDGAKARIASWKRGHGRVKQIAREMRSRLLDEPVNSWVPTSTFDVLARLEYDRPYHLSLYVDALDRVLNERVRLVFHAPPQHGKTTTTLASICFHSLTSSGKNIAYVTYSGDRAKDVMKLEFVPMLERLNIEHSASGDKVLIRGGSGRGGTTVMFTSTSGRITGYRCDVIFLDDPIKGFAQAYSRSHRDLVWGFINGELLTRSFGTKGNSIVCLQTRWHTDDPAGRLIGEGWDYIRLPAVADSADDPNGRSIGDPLWPENQPLERLIERQRDERTWSCLYQGLPTPAGGYPFRDFVEYSEGFGGHEPTKISYGLDSAYSAGRGDYSVMVRLITNTITRVSHVDRVIRAQKKFIDFIPDIAAFYSEMPAEIYWYVGGQESTIADMTINHLRERIPNLPLITIPANSVGDKYQRSIPVQDAWNRGDVRLPEVKDAPMTQFIEVVTGWTGGRNEQDDDVDALAAAYFPIAAPELRPNVHRATPKDVIERGRARRLI